mmetsp:Transcript_31270/g.72926  ORF Transcript_31270/g.72926 Transcript_31270/m.72926 type:complete len:368 (-) Transcript_31270:36-1139(-)
MTAIPPHSSGNSAAQDWDAGQIIPQLYVGSIGAAQDCERLLEHGIVRVLTVAKRLQPEVAWTDAFYAKVKHTTVAIEDHPLEDILLIVPKVISIIDGVLSGTGGILVHCASGISRSVASCMAWLMVRRGYTASGALELVRTARKVANPNFGFMQALQLLEVTEKDVPAARERWKKANRSLKRGHYVAKFRKTAEALHARSKDLEEKLMALDLRSLPEEEVQALLEELEDLSAKCEAAIPQDTIDDGVARSIRVASSHKATVMLGRLRKAQPHVVAKLSQKGCSGDGARSVASTSASGPGGPDDHSSGGCSIAGEHIGAEGSPYVRRISPVSLLAENDRRGEETSEVTQSTRLPSKRQIESRRKRMSL